MIMYKAEFYYSSIRKIKVSRETEKFVVLEKEDGSDGRRVAKDSDYDCIRATFGEAKEVLIQKRSNRFDSAKRILAACEEKLERAKSLTESEVQNG